MTTFLSQAQQVELVIGDTNYIAKINSAVQLVAGGLDQLAAVNQNALPALNSPLAIRADWGPNPLKYNLNYSTSGAAITFSQLNGGLALYGAYQPNTLGGFVSLNGTQTSSLSGSGSGVYGAVITNAGLVGFYTSGTSGYADALVSIAWNGSGITSSSWIAGEVGDYVPNQQTGNYTLQSTDADTLVILGGTGTGTGTFTVPQSGVGIGWNAYVANVGSGTGVIASGSAAVQGLVPALLSGECYQIMCVASGVFSCIGGHNKFNTFVATGSGSAGGQVSGTFTVPPGVYTLTVQLFGAAGAGGAFSGSGTGFAAGGIAIQKTLNVQTTPGSVYSYVVGTGGVPATSGSGGSGGISTFSSGTGTGATVLMTVSGGFGGSGSTSGVAAAASVYVVYPLFKPDFLPGGGPVSGLTLTVAGQLAASVAAAAGTGGWGAASAFGFIGTGGTGVQTGANASGFVCGGGGAACNVSGSGTGGISGGSGAPAYLTISWN